MVKYQTREIQRVHLQIPFRLAFKYFSFLFHDFSLGLWISPCHNHQLQLIGRCKFNALHGQRFLQASSHRNDWSCCGIFNWKCSVSSSSSGTYAYIRMLLLKKMHVILQNNNKINQNTRLQ